MKSNTTAAERGAMLAKHVTSQRQKQSGMVKVDKPNRQQRRAAKRATPKVAVATPDVAPADLPEPDFTLDGGDVRCYYESTVRRSLAAHHPEHTLGMVAGAPAQEDAEDAARWRFLSGSNLTVRYHTKGRRVFYALAPRFTNYEIDYYASLAEAIDAAMAQGKEGES